MNHLFKTALVAVSIVLFALPIGAAEVDSLSLERQRTITVRGEASLSVKPNLALITFGIISQAEQVATALDANNQSMTKVFDTIKTIGIADKNVRTSGFNVIPQYEPGRVLGRARRIVGYSVQNRVTVKLHNLSKISFFMSKVLNQGANRFYNLRFTNEDMAEQQNKLLQAAVKDAGRKARILADSAGAKLGKVLKITQGDTRPPEPRPMFTQRLKDAGAVPIALGERTIRASVTVVFGID